MAGANFAHLLENQTKSKSYLPFLFPSLEMDLKIYMNWSLPEIEPARIHIRPSSAAGKETKIVIQSNVGT